MLKISIIMTFLLLGCEQRAEKVDPHTNTVQEKPQELHEKGYIDTH